jgi:hypothetical protein
MRSTDVTNIGTGHPEKIIGITKRSHRTPNWVCKKEQVNEFKSKPTNAQDY